MYFIIEDLIPYKWVIDLSYADGILAEHKLTELLTKILLLLFLFLHHFHLKLLTKNFNHSFHK
jgi:hypothetical protein